MLFDHTLFGIASVAVLLGLSVTVAAMFRIAKSRLGYSWSYSSSRRRS